MEIIWQTIAAFIAIVGFGLLLEVPQKHIIHAGIAGAVCWLSYLTVLEMGYSLIAAAFWSSIFVALLSHSFARMFKAPVTVFLLSGILPTVPGASIYRSVYYLIQGASSLSNVYFMETLQISGAMAMAIFIVDSIFRLMQKR